MRIILSCPGCGKSFGVFPSNAGKIYCSQACRSLTLTTDRVCPTCSKTFRVSVSTAAWRVYCSKACLIAAKHREATCPVCDKVFTPTRPEGVYCGTRCAGIARARRAIDRFHQNLPHRPVDGCWLWQGLRNKEGYGRFYGYGRYHHAHRYAYEHFVGPIPDGLILRHTCDNPPCCNPAHLIPGTDRENTRDKMERGRFVLVLGADHPNAKLTEADVRQIRELIAERSFTYQQIAAHFGVSDSLIDAIRSGRAWRHVD
jgi:endogenous inhibitor of DNA gyrase (YacG/DUF329 family)